MTGSRNRKSTDGPATRRWAVTGGVGCGKSTVAGLLRDWGIPTLDADDVARSLLDGKHPVARRVLKEFGEEIRNPDGCVNRTRLAERVFRDPKEREKLNRLMHPAILRECRAWIARRQEPVAVVVIPLLHELNLEKEWDEVLCVTSRRDTALNRLRGRGWTRAEALRRMRAQLPLRIKARRSTRVIENNGSLEELKRSVQAAFGLNRGRKVP